MTRHRTDEQAAAIARRYRQCAAVIAEAQEEQKALQARFRDLVPVGYALDVDGKTASKTAPSRSFSLELALGVAGYVGITPRYEQVVDTADLKARLKAVGKLDEAMTPGTGAETVRLA